MRVRIRRDDLEITGELDERVRRRIEFAMGRVAGAINEVSSILDDLSGSVSRERIQCSVCVRLVGGQEVEVVEADREIGIAIDTALERAARETQRRLELDRRRYAHDKKGEPS